MTFIFDAIKELCNDIIMSNVYSDIFIGTVMSDKPINIKISDKLILYENQLIFSRNVCDFKVEVNLSPNNPMEPENKIDYEKRTEIIVYNHLNVGEKVVLVRSFGGQSFFIIDRIL